jgi:hypothetical protein
MTHDRLDGDDLPLVQEFPGHDAGGAPGRCHRGASSLEEAGAIKAARGLITIVTGHGSKRSLAGATGPPEAEYRRLVGRCEEVSMAMPCRSLLSKGVPSL